MGRGLCASHQIQMASLMMLAIATMGPMAPMAAGQSPPSAGPTPSYIAQNGADLVATSGGAPVHFNGIDVVALHRRVETDIGQLAVHFNVSAAVVGPARPVSRWPRRPRYVGRNGSNIEMNADAGGRVLVDGVDIVRGAWLLRGVLDAIKTSVLGSSAVTVHPDAAGEPPLCHHL